jgi:hypothetical protein
MRPNFSTEHLAAIRMLFNWLATTAPVRVGRAAKNQADRVKSRNGRFPAEARQKPGCRALRMKTLKCCVLSFDTYHSGSGRGNSRIT